MLKVYGDLESGNCYKVKLLLVQLGRPHQWVHVDILEKQTRTPDFLSKNPNGKIPLLEIEEGVYLPESDAILNYLAEGTPFLHSERLLRAQVLQWLFFEQYSHEPYIAVERYTIADIGLYAYTHVAHEGGFELSPYPAVQAWLERVRSQHDHVTMRGE